MHNHAHQVIVRETGGMTLEVIVICDGSEHFLGYTGSPEVRDADCVLKQEGIARLTFWRPAGPGEHCAGVTKIGVHL